MEFYAVPPDGMQYLQQGDLLQGVPFTYFFAANARVGLEEGGVSQRDLTQNRDGVEFIATKAAFSWGLVLTQTCDLQPGPNTGHSRKPILIARVRPIKELVRNFKDDAPKSALNEVKKLATAGNAPTLFYLPEYESDARTFEKAGADLLDLQRFDPSDLTVLAALLRLRLSVPALQALQERCSYCFPHATYVKLINTILQALQERCSYCFGRFATPDALYFSEEEWAESQRQEQARRQGQ